MSAAKALSLAGVLALAASEASAQGSRRGPVEVREEWLLAQPRLTLPAVSPDSLPRGATRVRVHLNWGNDFGWSQSAAGEAPSDREFLVDGEHRTLEIAVRRGLRDDLDLGLRLPLRWRGGGVLDELIDRVHVVTRAVGLPDNDRPQFAPNRFRVEGRDEDRRALRWSGTGAGLGNAELDVHWAFAGAGPSRGWSVAAVGRVGLPTGSGPFRTGGVDGGGQLVAARVLGDRLDLYLGAGATVFGRRRVAGLRFPRWRGHGFVAVEWRPASVLSLVVEVDGSTRLVANLAGYPGLQSYLHVSGRLDLGQAGSLEAGFLENLVHQQATTDFGVFLGWARRF